MQLSGLCTPWPAQLDVDAHFPVRVDTLSLVHSGTSIADERARTVRVEVKLACFQLKPHEREKLLRIIGNASINRPDETTQLARADGDRWAAAVRIIRCRSPASPRTSSQDPSFSAARPTRYDADSDTLTLHVDQCPTRVQNRQYALYLLTVLVLEARRDDPQLHAVKQVRALNPDLNQPQPLADDATYVFANWPIAERVRRLQADGAALEKVWTKVMNSGDDSIEKWVDYGAHVAEHVFKLEKYRE